jgi:hypothetical protein
VSQELKSAQQIIALLQKDMNTLKKQFMQDNMLGNSRHGVPGLIPGLVKWDL